MTAYIAYDSSHRSEVYRFDEITNEIRETAERRVELYNSALKQMAAMFETRPQLSVTEFHVYVRSMNVDSNYPGFISLGYLSPLNNYFDVKLFEQIPGKAQGSWRLGDQVYTKSEFATFLEEARDAGAPVLSRPFKVRGRSSVETMVLATPVFAEGSVPASIRNRRSRIIGYVFGQLQASTLFAGLLNGPSARRAGLKVEIFTADAKSKKIFEGGSEADSMLGDVLYSREFVVRVGERPFRFSVSTRTSDQRFVPQTLAALVFLCGAILSFFAFTIIMWADRHARRIQKSERQLRLVTDSLPVLIAYIDKKSVFRFCNRTGEEWLGYERTGVTGFDSSEAFGESTFRSIAPFLDRALKGERLEFESHFMNRKGERRPTSVSLLPDIGPFRDIRGVVIQISDLTERVKSEKRSKFLFELSGLLTASLDTEKTAGRFAQLLVPRIGDWCFVELMSDSGTLHRLSTNQDSSEELGRLYPLARPLEDSHPSMCAITSGNPIHIGPTQTQELTDLLVFDDVSAAARGKTIRSIIVVPLKARERVFGAVTIGITNPNRSYQEDDLAFIEEVSRKASLALDNARLYQAAQGVNRAKDEFLATLSHELRTPMNVILGWLDILTTEEVDEETHQMALETLNRNAKLQIQLINDLLDISRIINGKLVLHMHDSELERLAKNSYESMLPTAKAKNIDLKFTTDETGSYANVDNERLQQVLWNLLSNALKFTQSGGTVEVAVKRNGPNISVSVIDSGKGIEADFL
ncbi:MAG: histidine kinase dimerization/phospho-acceptor domain-containing protein, partial [Bdellovibrionota bacterium]